VIADPLRQTVHASGAEVFGNEHAACGLQPLRKVPDWSSGHPPLHTNQPRCVLRRGVERIQAGHMLLSVQGHLFKEVARVPPVHVQPRFELAPGRGRRG